MNEAFLARLRELCGIDSPTHDLAGVDACASLLACWCAAAGLAVELVETPSGLSVIARLERPGSGRTLLVGHHDTVFPRGTAASRPVQLVGDRALGPGVADMKGGVLVGLAVLERLVSGNEACGTVELHCVPDEEGRDVAPFTLERWSADACITLECGRASGAIVSARKAGGWITLEAQGRGAHSGTSWREGRSALRALTIETLRIERELHEARPEMSCVITELHAGVGKNTVPPSGTATVDVRAQSREDMLWAVSRIKDFGVHDGVTLRSSDDPGFPPLTRAPWLVEASLAALGRHGAAALEEQAGGVSDGSWASYRGIPTVDGLGPIGDDDHTEREWIDLRSVEPRVAAVADLCVAIGSR